jgi:hypothetical protein
MFFKYYKMIKFDDSALYELKVFHEYHLYIYVYDFFCFIYLFIYLIIYLFIY